MFLIVFSSVFWTASKGLAALTGHAATHPVQAPYLAGTAVGSVPGRLPQVRAFIIAVMNSSAGQEDGCYRAKWALSPAAAPSPWDWAGGVWGAWWGCSFGERLWGLQLGCWAQRDLGPKVPAAVFSGGGEVWGHPMLIGAGVTDCWSETPRVCWNGRQLNSESCRVAQEMGLGGKSCKSQCKAISRGWQGYPCSSRSWLRSHICCRQPLLGCDCSLDRGRAAVNLAWQ